MQSPDCECFPDATSGPSAAAWHPRHPTHLLGGGLLVDSWLHTSPIFTLIGMVLGIGAAMYTIWDVAKQSMRR